MLRAWYVPFRFRTCLEMLTDSGFFCQDIKVAKELEEEKKCGET
jgi:hypothetical protein